MGYNTTVVVLNDALDAIESDPQFGARLAAAIRQLAVPGERAFVHVQAHGARYVHDNAAIVIETHHADQIATVEVGQNFGKVVAGPAYPRNPHRAG